MSVCDVFVDGACSNNGKEGATAGIGVYIPKKDIKISQNLLNFFAETNIEDNTVSNNRAELCAIYKALLVLSKGKTDINIYSDSQYSINCLTKFYPNWVKQNKLKGKKNLDIIQPIMALQCMVSNKVSFIHINSHTKRPDETTAEFYVWNGNDIVDKLAVVGKKSK
jgi:ribonuclease HI